MLKLKEGKIIEWIECSSTPSYIVFMVRESNGSKFYYSIYPDKCICVRRKLAYMNKEMPCVVKNNATLYYMYEEPVWYA
jgi:hypothetical protein